MDEDAEQRAEFIDFFKNVVNLSAKQSKNYAEVLINKSIGSIGLLAKRCKKKENYLSDMGFDPDDIEDITEALEEFDAKAKPTATRSTSEGAQLPPSQTPPPTPHANGEGREVSSQQSFLNVHKFTEVMGVLGEGGMARAYHCVYAGTEVAAKEVSSEMNMGLFLREIEIHSALNHPSLVGVLGVVRARIEEYFEDQREVSSDAVISRSGKHRVVEDVSKRLLVVHYCSKGSLKDYLKLVSAGRIDFDERLCLRMMHEVALGMAFLHSKNPPVVHLDLKPANIFLNDDFHALVGDFGLATPLQKVREAENLSNSMVTATVSGFCAFNGGTLYYLPPEAFVTRQMTNKSDIFAYAIILHNVFVTQDDESTYDATEVLAGGNPTQYTAIFVRKLVQNMRPILPPKPRVALTPEVQEAIYAMMQECWQGEAKQRPSFEKIANRLKILRDELERKAPTPTSFYPMSNSQSGKFGANGRGLLLAEDEGDSGKKGAVANDVMKTDPIHLTTQVHMFPSDSEHRDRHEDNEVSAALAHFPHDNNADTGHKTGNKGASSGGYTCQSCRKVNFPREYGIFCSVPLPSTGSSAAAATTSEQPSSQHFLCRTCLLRYLRQQTDSLPVLTSENNTSNVAAASNGPAGFALSRSSSQQLRYQRHDLGVCCQACLCPTTTPSSSLLQTSSSSNSSTNSSLNVSNSSPFNSFTPSKRQQTRNQATKFSFFSLSQLVSQCQPAHRDGEDNLDVLQQYFSPLRALLFHCTRCDTVMSFDALEISQNDERASSYDKLKKKISPPSLFQELLRVMSDYTFGDITVNSFYMGIVSTYFPALEVVSDATAWNDYFKDILSLIPDLQKRAALHLRYLQDRPYITMHCGGDRKWKTKGTNPYNPLAFCNCFFSALESTKSSNGSSNGHLRQSSPNDVVGTKRETVKKTVTYCFRCKGTFVFVDDGSFDAQHILCCEGGSVSFLDLFSPVASNAAIADASTEAPNSEASYSTSWEPTPPRCLHCYGAHFQQYNSNSDRNTSNGVVNNAGNNHGQSDVLHVQNSIKREQQRMLNFLQQLRDAEFVCQTCNISKQASEETRRYHLLRQFVRGIACASPFGPPLSGIALKRQVLDQVVSILCVGPAKRMPLTPSPFGAPRLPFFGAPATPPPPPPPTAQSGNPGAEIPQPSLEAARIFRRMYPVEVAQGLVRWLRKHLALSWQPHAALVLAQICARLFAVSSTTLSTLLSSGSNGNLANGLASPGLRRASSTNHQGTASASGHKQGSLLLEEGEEARLVSLALGPQVTIPTSLFKSDQGKASVNGEHATDSDATAPPVGIKDALEYYHLLNSETVQRLQFNQLQALDAVFAVFENHCATSTISSFRDQAVAAYHLLIHANTQQFTHPYYRIYQLYERSRSRENSTDSHATVLTRATPPSIPPVAATRNIQKEDENRLLRSTRRWVEVRKTAYYEAIRRYLAYDTLRQACFVFGDTSFVMAEATLSATSSSSTKKTVSYIPSTNFNAAISNPLLSFSDNFTQVGRSGQVSSAPVAFAPLLSDTASIALQVLRCETFMQHFSFGLVRVGTLHNTGGDGIGLTHGTYGYFDYRQSSIEPAHFAANGHTYPHPRRKLKREDILVMVVNTREGWATLSINMHQNVNNASSTEMTFAIPKGLAKDYRFAVCLAPEHRVKILHKYVGVQESSSKATAAAEAAKDTFSCHASGCGGRIVQNPRTLWLWQNWQRHLREWYLCLLDRDDSPGGSIATLSDPTVQGEKSRVQWVVEAVASMGISSATWEARYGGRKRQAAAAFERFHAWLEWKLQITPAATYNDAVDDGNLEVGMGISAAAGSSSTTDDKETKKATEGVAALSSDAEKPEDSEIAAFRCKDFVAAIAWLDSNQTYWETQQQQILTQTFLAMHGKEDAPFCAANILRDFHNFEAPVTVGTASAAAYQKPTWRRILRQRGANLTTNDRMALAYMQLHSSEMQGWYAQDLRSRDPFVPGVCADCRCLPRHFQARFPTCPAVAGTAGTQPL